MKNKEQIELAQKIIANTQDYIELAKVQRKLKVENVDQQLDNVTNFIKNNVHIAHCIVFVQFLP